MRSVMRACIGSNRAPDGRYAEIDLPASPYRLLNALDEIGIKSTKEIVYQEILNYGSFGYTNMIIHQRSIPLTCLTASIAKPIKYDKEHDLIGCKKSRCLSPDLRRIFGHGGRGHLLYGRTCNPGQRRSQAQISSMKPLLRHGQLTAQQNIKGRMPCIYFGLNLFCSQVAMRPPCVAIIERAKCLKLLI